MDLLIVGIGGAFGGLARFEVGKLIASHTPKGKFSFATFIVNITGAVLLGMLSATTADHLYLLLGDGFLGAYTTFSTFMYEGFHLFRSKKGLNALIYVLITVVLGILGYMCGFACMQWIL
jgi:CrcB protein